MIKLECQQDWLIPKINDMEGVEHHKDAEDNHYLPLETVCSDTGMTEGFIDLTGTNLDSPKLVLPEGQLEPDSEGYYHDTGRTITKQQVISHVNLMMSYMVERFLDGTN